jgi:hypothetical protein
VLPELRELRLVAEAREGELLREDTEDELVDRDTGDRLLIPREEDVERELDALEVGALNDRLGRELTVGAGLGAGVEKLRLRRDGVGAGVLRRVVGALSVETLG